MDTYHAITAEEAFNDASGAHVLMHVWRPAQPRAILAICHGFNAHGGQYAPVAEHFAQRGFAVYALDLRGRGRSGGDRFFVERIDDYVADLAALMQFAKGREGALPVFLLGHSAGGVVACSYAVRHQAGLAGLICESFAFRVPAPAAVLGIVKWLSGFLPKLPVLKLKNRDFSRDPAAVAALDRDPLIAGEAQPARTVAAMVRANEALQAAMPSITLPLLILHGTADKVTLPEGSHYFHAHAGSADKTLKLYEGHVHDLLVDVGREEVLDTIERWMEQRMASG